VILKDRLYAFLKELSPKLCVISTVSIEAAPESALMAYAVDRDLTVILSTSKKTRKAQNLENNSRVALVFGLDSSHPNVQYEGRAEVAADGEAYLRWEETFFSVNPEMKRYKTTDSVYLKVYPQWYRMTDYSVNPPEVEEERAEGM
jgi:pyridoxine/pyridoxamine 5'-phosphate oxidase